MMGSNLMVNKRLTGVPRPRCSSSLALIKGWFQGCLVVLPCRTIWSPPVIFFGTRVRN